MTTSEQPLTGTAVVVAGSAGVAHTRRRRLSALPGRASLIVGLSIVGLYLLVTVVSFFWTPYDPQVSGVGEIYQPPSSEFWMGTDRLGQDVFSRLMAGTRIDLGITVAAVAAAALTGTFLGTIAGYYGGWLDAAILRVTEVVQAFPALLLAMLIVQAVGPGLFNIVAVMAFVGFPDYLRLARAEVMSRRTWQYAEAARMVGSRSWRVAFRHLLPNSTGPLYAFTSINAAAVALNTASLGFLGLGLEAGTPEWGSMIARGRDGIMTGDWWVSFFPGLAILGLAGAFYLLGDAISDITDPRRKS